MHADEKNDGSQPLYLEIRSYFGAHAFPGSGWQNEGMANERILTPSEVARKTKALARKLAKRGDINHNEMQLMYHTAEWCRRLNEIAALVSGK